MQIPILNGIYTDNSPSVRVAYPLNYIPIVQDNGVSSGFLKPAEGIETFATGSGIVRGGIVWDGVLYMVIGSNLSSIDSSGNITTIGSVGGYDEPVKMDYSFDRLAIASNEELFYYDGTTLAKVTDSDLGTVVDMQWVDGYFMTTDGEYLAVSDLSDPTSFNPLKYGSSEIDPDSIVAILKVRNEIHAINRHTIEIFNNIGGDLFPFQVQDGAQITKGCVGTNACCVYMDIAVAFVGGGRNEPPSVYLGANATATKISTQQIDKELKEYSETQLSQIKVETRKDNDNYFLYVHLLDKTLVYDHISSQSFSEPVWFTLSSGINEMARYRANNFVYAYGKWICGDPTGNSIGYLTDEVGTHYGSKVTWGFSTKMIYNESNGAIFNELELVPLAGRIALGDEPIISTSYSIDGLTWSQDRYKEVGKIGDRAKRLSWYRQGMMRHFRIQRFRGDSDAHLSFLRLEATLEPLTR